MRILRPALLGFLIASFLGGGLLLLPQETNDTTIPQPTTKQQEELPPKLFPMYSQRREYERRTPLLRLTKAPLQREVTPKADTPFSISIENIGGETLHDLRVEERFDGSLLSVDGAGGGTVGTNTLAWNVDSLRGGERWLTTYRLRVAPDTSRRTIETTVLIAGDALRGTPTSSRMATSTLTIIPLPRTGVPMPTLLRWLYPALHSVLGNL